MSNVPSFSITYVFNGDVSASNKINAAALDTQLGNIATAQNQTKAALDNFTDGQNHLAVGTVGVAQLSVDVMSLIAGSYTPVVIPRVGPLTVSNGGSATIPDYAAVYQMTAPGAVNAYTLTLPPGPIDTQRVRIAMAIGTILTFTILPNSGQLLATGANPGALANGAFLELQYNSTNTTWYRIG